jgi:hypothetical protein
LIAETIDDFDEALVSEAAEECEVKLSVRFEEAGEVASFCGAQASLDEFSAGGEVVGAEVEDDFVERGDLEHCAHLKDLVEVVVCEGWDSETTVTNDFDQPELLEIAERFADRGGGDAEELGELGHVVELPRFEFPRDDFRAEQSARLDTKAGPLDFAFADA